MSSRLTAAYPSFCDFSERGEDLAQGTVRGRVQRAVDCVETGRAEASVVGVERFRQPDLRDSARQRHRTPPRLGAVDGVADRWFVPELGQDRVELLGGPSGAELCRDGDHRRPGVGDDLSHLVLAIDRDDGHVHGADAVGRDL